MPAAAAAAPNENCHTKTLIFRPVVFQIVYRFSQKKGKVDLLAKFLGEFYPPKVHHLSPVADNVCIG